MGLQTLPSAARTYSRRQRAEIAAAVAAVKRQWARMGPDFDLSWASIAPTVMAITLTAQERVAAGGMAYVPAVLAETGQDAAVAPTVRVSPRPLVGVAGDGREVATLLQGAVVQAKTAIGRGASVPQALSGASRWLTMTTGTLLSDTGRQAESLAMGVRPVTHYVRMLNPPSCSRCAVLAGQTYKRATPFLRHPGCDCRHIPASETKARDLTVDTDAYFASLDQAQQEQIFTIDGARAIREGADIGQVVNARRGMTTSQTASGRRILTRSEDGSYTTAEGTTRRGYAQVITGRERGFTRLMPESIAEIAGDDRELYLNLLARNGYL